jgi:hypothetical protein
MQKHPLFPYNQLILGAVSKYKNRVVIYSLKTVRYFHWLAILKKNIPCVVLYMDSYEKLDLIFPGHCTP